MLTIQINSNKNNKIIIPDITLTDNIPEEQLPSLIRWVGGEMHE